MIYKIHYGVEEYIKAGSNGFVYVGSKAEAVREIRSRKGVRGRWPKYTYTYSSGDDGDGNYTEDRAAIEITSEATPRTKQAWIAYLNANGGHPDNG